jgi:hypothetical protein
MRKGQRVNYGHASPIVARRKNLNPIDLISVILVE